MELAYIVGLKVVTIGGGSGGFMLNSGLLQYPVERTAISTVFDNGGSSGRLRVAHGALPSGDLRRLLVALIDDKDGKGEILRELFSFRFPEGNDSSLKGQSLGNLIMTAAEEKWGRLEGIRKLSRLLNIQGTVLPISIDDAHLNAELSDGTILKGESAIDTRDCFDERTVRHVYLEPEALILRDAAEAIMEADVILLGPGDHYTSLIPNLLVRGFGEAMRASKGKVVYVANLMTKAAESRSFSLLSFVEDLFKYDIGRERFDAVVLNTATPPEEILRAYKDTECAEMVVARKDEEERLKSFTNTIITGDYLDDASLEAGLVRHDPAKLVRAILSL